MINQVLIEGEDLAVDIVEPQRSALLEEAGGQSEFLARTSLERSHVDNSIFSHQ